MYYDIQKAALRCEESIYKNQAIVQTANNICNADRDALSNIINLSNDIRNPLATTSFKDAAEKKQYLLSQTQSFIQGLENPVDEKGKKYIDVLAEAGETLATSPSPADIAQAQELKKAVNLYNEMKQNKTADSNVLVQKLTELSSLLMGYQVDDNEARSLNLADALSRYMAIKNTGNLASTINSSRMLQQAIDHGNREASEVVSNLKKMTDQNAIDLALSSMVSTLKPEFEQRLEELNKDYLAYKDKEKNAERHLQWLSEMLSICMSTQGMSYFPNHPNQSRLNMQDQPNKKYQQICEQFNCPNESIFVPFESKTDRYGSGSRVEKFESYQCALDRKLPLANQKLADNLKTTGKICGNK